MNEKFEKETKVVIIGGGIVGTSTAYCLAKKGEKDVILIDAKELASEASGANTASMAPWSVQEYRRGASMRELARIFLKAIPDLTTELRYDIEYVTPRITVIEEEHLERFRKYVDVMHEAGIAGLRLIGEDEIIRLEPYLTRRENALYDPDGGRINPLYLTTGLGDKARELGIKIYEYTEVLGIKQERGRVKSVITNRGEVKAEYIVNACGLWAPRIGEMVGLKIPITPLLAQMVVTEELPVRIVKAGSISISSYAAAEEVAEKLMAYPVYKQMKKGNLLLGVTESPGENKCTTSEGIQALCQLAVQNFPLLRDMGVNAIRTYANFYAVTPNRRPILGLVQGIMGLIMACGLNDYGMSLGYGVGEVISNLICYGDNPFPIDDLNFSRFS